MNPRVVRILVPIAVAIVGIAVVVLPPIFTGSRSGNTAPAGTSESQPAGANPAGRPEESTSAPAAPPANSSSPAAPPSSTTSSFDGLIAKAPPAPESMSAPRPATRLGSLDPAAARLEIELSPVGAGISRIAFSDIWETVQARRQAKAHQSDPAEPAPDEAMRYVLHATGKLVNARLPEGADVTGFAANVLEINGQPVNVFAVNVGADGTKSPIWTEVEPGTFVTVVENANADPIVRVTRKYELAEEYGIVVHQKIENLAGAPITVKWHQFGPGDLREDRSRYMDIRRLRFGYTIPARDPDHHVLSEDSDLIIDRASLLRLEQTRIWPTEDTTRAGYDLAWFGWSSRYFAIAVHPLLDAQGRGDRTISPLVETVRFEQGAVPGSLDEDARTVFMHLSSPATALPPGGSANLDFGIYAGPLDRHALGEHQPFRSLAMSNLILYQMSSMCAWCTFQWLAHLLLAFLALLHNYVVFDWGLAIIGLVIVVRALLHPITKRSQIGMTRFSRQMAALRPELEKIKQACGNDAKKLQQEQMRLMRERGISPFQMLGCLPLFLQTPIWIALYAMLYFAFDLRHAPAFFGVFQSITGGAWNFLGDLSAGDHFFWEFNEPVKFLMWTLTGINLLPILMGVIFFIQQKYMTPPPTATMSPEQVQQQKIMKFMMVVMMPVLLYSAPSGLTLYILTSSTIGILESRYVRRHIDELDKNPPDPSARAAKAKSRDSRTRAYAAAIDRFRQKQLEKAKGKEKKYKRRESD